jgi:peroxiredoxin
VNAVVLADRFVLALVFAAAAIAKLADREATRRMLEQFGLGRRPGLSGAVVLPLVELAAAGGLLFDGTARAAGLAAGALLVAFCLAIARVLARGDQARCNCFGALREAPVGIHTLVRNAAFVALAAVVVLGRDSDGAAALAWVSSNATVLALTGAVGAQALFSWQLFAQNGRLLQRLTELESHGTTPALRGLPAGTAAPDFALEDLNEALVTLDDVLAPGVGALLVFSDAGCAHCTPLLPAIAAAQVESATPVVLITAGDESVNRARAEEHGIGSMLFQRGFEVAERYGVYGAPAAVVVDASGRIAAEPAEGRRAVVELLDAYAAVAA